MKAPWRLQQQLDCRTTCRNCLAVDGQRSALLSFSKHAPLAPLPSNIGSLGISLIDMFLMYSRFIVSEVLKVDHFFKSCGKICQRLICDKHLSVALFEAGSFWARDNALLSLSAKPAKWSKSGRVNYGWCIRRRGRGSPPFLLHAAGGRGWQKRISQWDKDSNVTFTMWGTGSIGMKRPQMACE